MYRVDANAVALVLLRQLCTGIGELKGAYAYLITGFEQLIGYPQGIDIDPIGAAYINDAVAALHLLQVSMVSGDLWMVQDNGIIWMTSKANLRSA